MLLQHAWLAPLAKPETITEEDEEEAEAAMEAEAATGAVGGTSLNADGEVIVDQEVADWVKDALEKRKNGTLGKGAPKPALHAAPLDAMTTPSPSANGVMGMDFAAKQAA